MIYHAVNDDAFIGAQCNDEFSDRRVRVKIIAFVCLNAISALLSIIGSSTIIYIIWRGGREKLRRVQNRLLLCMSIIDIFNSTALGFSVVLIPKAKCSFGYGNIATCTTQGFFMQLGMAVPGYMAMLSLCSLLSIVFGVSERVITRRYEVLMHAVALLPMLIVAIVGAANKVYNSQTGTGHCWVEETTCEENCDGLNLKGFGNGSWVVLVTIVWIIFTTCIILFSMLGIYCKIQKRGARMRTYEFKPKAQSQTLKSPRQPSALEIRASQSAKQAMLYIAGYTLTYIWSGIHICVYRGRSDVLYIFTGLFLPLQGFWNFLVYIRPRFIAIRRENHELSVFSTLKAVILAAKNHSSRRSPRMHRRPGFNQNQGSYPDHQLKAGAEDKHDVNDYPTNDFVKKDDGEDDFPGDISSLFAKNNEHDANSNNTLPQDELAKIHEASFSFVEEEIDLKTALEQA